MKFKIQISGKDVFVSAEQLEHLMEIVSSTECVVQEWVGSGRGTNGTNSISCIRPCDMTTITVQPILDEVLDTLRFATKVYDDAK